MDNKPWNGKGVVIIDDSRRVREELRAVFTACGMQVLGEADTGIGGLDLVKKHNPEVVSLDLIMPEMDGVECYKRLQVEAPLAKVVMITWLGGEAKILENLKDSIPAHAFQSKPCSAAELAACLERVYFPNSIKIAASKTAGETADDFLDLGVKVS